MLSLRRSETVHRRLLVVLTVQIDYPYSRSAKKSLHELYSFEKGAMSSEPDPIL